MTRMLTLIVLVFINTAKNTAPEISGAVYIFIVNISNYRINVIFL